MTIFRLKESLSCFGFSVIVCYDSLPGMVFLYADCEVRGSGIRPSLVNIDAPFPGGRRRLFGLLTRGNCLVSFVSAVTDNLFLLICFGSSYSGGERALSTVFYLTIETLILSLESAMDMAVYSFLSNIFSGGAMDWDHELKYPVDHTNNNLLPIGTWIFF